MDWQSCITKTPTESHQITIIDFISLEDTYPGLQLTKYQLIMNRLLTWQRHLPTAQRSNQIGVHSNNEQRSEIQEGVDFRSYTAQTQASRPLMVADPEATELTGSKQPYEGS